MQKIKTFLLRKENIKSYWQGLNWLMAFIVSMLAYIATDGVEWAVAVLPVAKIVSEMITRYLNNAYENID